MKRHPALQDLSREHYRALKLALDAKHAAQSGEPEQIAAAAEACRASFSLELEHHFQSEERDLLPRLQATGEHALVQRTLADHAVLRALNHDLTRADAAILLRFAEAMNAHVRFEERELFEAMERLLAADQ